MRAENNGDSCNNPKLRQPSAMARLARIVIPGIAHHITQRGNRLERLFFEDDDFALYLAMLRFGRVEEPQLELR